jgi:hypothetical protein
LAASVANGWQRPELNCIASVFRICNQELVLINALTLTGETVFRDGRLRQEKRLPEASHKRRIDFMQR